MQSNLVSGTGGMSDEDFSGGQNSKSKEKNSPGKATKAKSLNKNLFKVLSSVKNQIDQVNKSEKVKVFKAELMD